MILSSWLAAVFGRLKASSIQSRRRGRGRGRLRNPSITPTSVEMLEQRKLLTNPVITSVGVNLAGGIQGGNFAFSIPEAEQIFPYPSSSYSVGQVVATVNVFDPDASPNNYTNNLTITGGTTDVSGQDGPAFYINGNNQICINDPRDFIYELTPNHTFVLQLTATDVGGATGTAAVTITLRNDTYDRPVIPQYPYQAIDYAPKSGDDASGVVPRNSVIIQDPGVNVLRVKENSVNGTVVGTVTAIDNDSNPASSPLTYSLVGTVPGKDAQHPAFKIDPFTGVVTVIDSSFLNYEVLRNPANGVGNLGEGGLIFNGVSIFPDVTLDLQVRATDVHGQFSQTYQPTTGQIQDSHVYIRVLDVGEVPPDISKSTKSMTIDENTPAGFLVGYFQLIDGVPNFFTGSEPASPGYRIAKPNSILDPSNSEPQKRYSFAIVGGNVGNAFAIDYTTGAVTIANPVNYETLNVYNLQIQVTDNNVEADQIVAVSARTGAVQNFAPLTTVATLHITVNDINEPTSIPNGQKFTIPENTVNGTIVGTVVATDPDLQQPNGNGSLVYSIISGNTVNVGGVNYPNPQPDPSVGIFSIDPATGTITVNNQSGLAQALALNFENQPSFSLSVRVVDRGDLTTAATNTVVINLSNVNETPPSLSNYTFGVTENSPFNTLVGTVTAAVGELGNTINSYQITAVTGVDPFGNIVSSGLASAFSIDNSGKITVNNQALIDYEQYTQFTLTVKATDNGTPPLSTTGSVTINIQNVNEQIVMLNQLFTVNENTPNGTVIGQILTTDPDNAAIPNTQGTLFTINGGNTGNAFDIDTQGHIIVTNVSALNFEVNPTFSLAVSVKDTGPTAIPATSTSATMTVNLVNVNDPPVIVANQSFNIKEHSLAGTVVGKVQATDEDKPKQTLTYSIIAGDPAGAFVINPADGTITVTDPHLVDYATTPGNKFTLTVQVTDNGTPPLTTTAPVTVFLQSVVTPPNLPSQTVTYPENQVNGTVIATAAATGGVGAYTYSIIGGNTGGAFTINPTTGVITVANSSVLNYESITSFGLKVLAVDSEATPLGDTATITVKLTNVNEPPILSGIEGTALNWVENNPGQYTSNLVTPVTAAILVSDTDGPAQNMSKATVQITGNYQSGEDQLVFVDTATITHTWDPVTGKLTLTGVDTQANYQAALRSVSYTDTSNAPNTIKRTVTYQIFDDGTDGVNPPGTPLPSNTVTRDINITPVNDPPTLQGIEGGPLTWIENTPPNYVTNNITPITGALTTADPDSINLTGATIQITGNYLKTEDVLVFTNTAKITGAWDPTTGKLTLTGTDTLANYQAALRSVSYTDTSNAPNTSPRTVTYQIIDDGALLSNTVSRNINITPVNDPPVLLGIEGTALNWNENTPPNYATNNVTPATATLIASDPDSAVLTGATVQITGNYLSTEDQLVFVNTANIAGSFNATTGTLTLSGTDTLANYTAALRSVAYTDTNNAPNTAKRTLTYQVSDDGPLLSNTVTRDINITPVNDPPVLSAIEGTALNWIENTPPNYVTNNVTPVTGSLLASDPDSINLTGATIQITGNYLKTEDVLVFTNTAKITGAWDPTTGKLTLTGTDTLANYTSALQSVAYTDTSNAPNTLKRTVSYQVTDDGTVFGPLTSNVVSRDINITPVNDPPMLSGIEASALTWAENTPPNYASNNVVPVTATLTTSDPDSVNLSGATVQITGNYLSTEDRLVFPNTANIVGTFNPITGTLTLTGTDTLANYTAALRSVAYTDTNNAPNTAKRTLTYQVSDDGPLLSNTVTRDINIVPVNDPPVLSAIEGTALNWIENTPPNYVTNNVTPVTGSLLASDPDSINLTGATIQITGNYLKTEDVLVFTNTAKITGTWDPTTGKLTLTGTDTLANYTSALQSVAYTDTSNAPNTLKRTVSYQVTDDGAVFGPLTSNVVSRDINITPVNDPPVLSGIEASALTWNENTPPNYVSNNVVPVTATLTTSDPDSVNLSGATVQITGNYLKTEDQLVFTNTTNIVGTFDPNTGILTLTGTDTLANYTAALRTVSYTDTSNAPNTAKRTLTYQVSDDGPLLSNTVTRDINIVPVNDPPVLSAIEGTALNWIENTPPNYVTNNVTPTTATLAANDPDSVNLTGATVTITGNYQSTEDQLVFTNTAKIIGSWNPATGTLTLTGTDTVANYQAALRSVSYTDTSNAPNILTRTLSYQVTDDGTVFGQLTSNIVTRNINITPVNDPPVLTAIEGGALNWIENTPPNYVTNNVTPVTASLVAGDPDSINLTGATIQITGNYLKTEDQLVFTNTAKITGSFDPNTGILTLSGTDTLANYQAALRSVSYTDISNAPNTLKRTVSYQVTDDGALASNVVSRDINITPVNDPPVLLGIEGNPLNWIENTPPNYALNNVTPVTGALVAADPDSAVLTGATVQITGNYQSAEDLLVFVNTPNITGSWNAATGKLTLTGTDTLPNYTAALRSVSFTDTSNAPNTAKRTVTYQTTDDGPLLSNTVSRDINITPVNDPPVLSGIESSALTWVENTPPNYVFNNITPVTATLTASDPDSVNLTGATIKITGNYQKTEDQLIFVNTANITGTFDPNSGTLTLTGTDTLANYTAALRSVSYTDINNAPNTAKRTLTYQVNDDGPLPSNTVTRDIVISPVNDPPVLSGIEATPLNWIENTPPNYATNNVTPITATLVAGDPDSINLTGATVTITGNYKSGEDQLVFTNTAKISGSWNPATGQLTLTGTDTLANYTAALESVAYTDTSNAPNIAKRTVTYQVSDDGPLLSNTVSRDINITPVNDPPTLSGIEVTPLTWIENTPPNYASNNVTPVTATLTPADPDSVNLTGATIQITGNYQSAEDRLVFTNTANITGTFNSLTGILTLTGTDTLANYAAALRSVSYTDLSNAPNVSKRTVTYQVSDDGPLLSNTVSRDINITPVNDPPTLSGIEVGALNWIESTPPVYSPNNVTPITATLVAGDPDSIDLTGATVQITGNFQANEDRLVFTNTAKITGSYDLNTGKLTLTGTDTLANYTAALRSVAYTDRFDAPNTSTRTVTYQVTDDGALLSNTVTRDITITPVNDPPVLIGLESNPLNYLENTTALVTGGIVATDPDSNNAQSATIQFAANYVPTEDSLQFTNTPKITGSFNPATGILTLTGVDTLTNYRAAIRSVSYYNSSDNPSTVVRTLGFQITDDSGLPSTTVYRNVNVIPVNDPPVLSSSLSTLNYTEGTGAQPINPATAVYDVDSPTFAGATITLVNYQSNQDVLGFVNTGAAAMGNISIQSNSGGILQLVSVGATATQAQWQAALDAVTYTNTSQNPNTTPRTVTFVADDGGNAFHLSNMLTTTITVIPVNNPPTLTNPSSVTYTENGAPLAIDTGIGVSDPDNTTFPSGVVTITNFLAAEDQINFTNDGSTMGDISIQSNVNGVLTLVSTSGTATAANWQSAFAAVTYSNSSDNPSNVARTVTYTLSDGAATSNVLTSTVNVVPVNDAPVLSGIEATPLQYVENTAPNFSTNNTTQISALIQASDPDSLLTSATIQITTNYVVGQDFLVFANTSTITGYYDTTTGTLTLTGSDTVANYTTALESVAYFNRSDTPSTLVRTVSYTVTDDGGPSGTPTLASNTVTRNITVTPVNDPSVLTNPDTTALNYTEDASSLPILPNVALTDADSNNLSGATITISANFNANGSQDTLTFVNTSKITGNWNPATGVLTLSGLDTVSNYRTALRSIGFFNQHDGLTAPTRTVTFTVVDDTAVSSNTVSRDINITTVPDGAILSSIETTTKVYKALDPYTPATPVTSTIVVTDYDSVNQTSAVIQISNNYVRGQDQLVIDGSVLTANQLNAAWDSASGKLTLTGNVPVINYQNALLAVKYINTSSTPNTATRTVSFQVFDDTTPTPLASNTLTRNVSISTANVVPLLSVNSGSPLAYTEKDPPTNVAPNLSIIDSDSPNMNGATIKITGNYLFPQDQLVFTNTGTIQGSWNASTGTLTLTGLDTISNYQAALEAVKYVNTSNNPSTLKRTVSFLVTDGLATSNAVTRDINVTPVNDPPVINTNANSPLLYTANGNPVVITPALTVTDPDSDNLASAQVAISFNYQRGLDLLTFLNTNKITGSFDVASGILTLAGIDSVSDYRSALQSVMYTFAGTPVGGNKTISFSASDGSANSVTIPGVTTRDIIFSSAPPVVNANTPSLAYPTGNVAVVIAPGLTVTTPQSNVLSSAVVQITSNYVNGTDVLAFTNTANITSTFDAVTGRLTLTGLDTVSNYRAALRSVTYTFNGTPNGPAKAITFSASDGISVSNFSTVNVYLASAPSVVSINDATDLIVASTPIVIAPGLTVTDPDSDYLVSAKVAISSNYVTGDVLLFTNTSRITGSFDASTGILTLSGIDTVGAYREALRTVQYGHSGVLAGALTSVISIGKTISFSVNDGFSDSNVATRNLFFSVGT